MEIISAPQPRTSRADWHNLTPVQRCLLKEQSIQRQQMAAEFGWEHKLWRDAHIEQFGLQNKAIYDVEDWKGWVPRAVSFSAGFMCAARTIQSASGLSKT